MNFFNGNQNELYNDDNRFSENNNSLLYQEYLNDDYEKIKNNVSDENQKTSISENKEIKNLKNTPQILNKKKKFGRKKKNDKENRKHNKYCEDNIIKKIKGISVSSLSSHINSKIKKIYNGNIGKGVLRKELLKMNQNQIIDLKSDKEFINKTLKDIFSNDISTKYTSFKSDHNRIIIERLLNENDVNKRIIFEKLFSLTFLECIMHMRGENHYDELEGLESLDDICKKFEDDDEYIELFRYYFDNFKETIWRKKQRNPKKK